MLYAINPACLLSGEQRVRLQVWDCTWWCIAECKLAYAVHKPVTRMKRLSCYICANLGNGWSPGNSSLRHPPPLAFSKCETWVYKLFTTRDGFVLRLGKNFNCFSHSESYLKERVWYTRVQQAKCVLHVQDIHSVKCFVNHKTGCDNGAIDYILILELHSMWNASHLHGHWTGVTPCFCVSTVLLSTPCDI